jgi:IMP dehydrogenase
MNITDAGFDFDDVYLCPRPSSVVSRDAVDLSTNLGNGLVLKLPIIASPMKGIISPELIIGLSELGGIGILHRFYDDDAEWRRDFSLIMAKAKNFGIAVGLNDVYDTDKVETVIKYGAKILLIDIANGYISSLAQCLAKCTELIKAADSKCLLMAGSVIDYLGAINLYKYGCDLIRVGIGSGHLCTTRKVTGVGFPQLSAIENCCINKQNFMKIIADGGIRSSGDAVKALAVGADAVMLGTLFAQTNESANNGIIYGMASRKIQESYYDTVKSIEGIEEEFKKTMSLEEFISEFTYGIKSACTYVDARNLYELNKHAEFVRKYK